MQAYNNVDTMAHVVQALREFCDSNAMDIAQLNSVTCVIDDANYAIVPSELFGQEHSSAYLDFCNDNEGNVVMSEHVAEAGCEVVYGVKEEFRKSLEELFPEVTMRHSAAVLVGDLIPRNKGLKQYVNVRQSDFDIMVADDDKLLFFNSFSFSGVDDFVYYIVTVMRQYGSSEDVELCFCGMVMPDSEVLKLVERYVRNVRFLDPDRMSADIEVPGHYFYVPLTAIPV